MKPHLRTLPVKLDPHEVAQRADELARELHDQAVAEEAAQSTKKKIAKDLEERANRISRLGRIVHTRREDRQIDCHEEHSALDGTARTIRDDTQEVVDTRPLTQEELRDARQEALPGFRVGSVTVLEDRRGSITGAELKETRQKRKAKTPPEAP